MLLRFFNNTTTMKPESSTAPISIEELDDAGFLVIDIPDFDYSSEEEDAVEASVTHVQIEPQLYQPTKEEAVAPIENQLYQQTNEEPNTRIEKSSRRLCWEHQHKKIAAIVHDESGQVIEIRRVNQGKQLAFWDDQKNTQVYVYRKANTQEIETKDKGVLRMHK
ncbi:MAG: hypothetical protein QG556_605 [Pseudomonadota bacterium]|nr:hypothetical protein [Pseudomonadota bacterium]